VVYELVMSWSQQAILLLLCGLLFYAALFYPGDELSRSLRRHSQAPPAAPASAVPLRPELPRLTPMGSACHLLPHLLSVAVHF